MSMTGKLALGSMRVSHEPLPVSHLCLVRCCILPLSFCLFFFFFGYLPFTKARPNLFVFCLGRL